MKGKPSLRECGSVLEQAAQGGGAFAIPGGVQETFQCCIEGCLVGNTGGRSIVGLDGLGGLSRPW